MPQPSHDNNVGSTDHPVASHYAPEMHGQSSAGGGWRQKAWNAWSDAQIALQRMALRASHTHRMGLIGWSGYGNLGDDAIAEAASRLLDSAALVRYEFAGRERRLQTLRLSGSSFFDAMLLGGGTLINTGWLDIVRYSLAQGIPTWAFGTGAGSSGYGMSAEVCIDEWASILPAFRYIGLRGPLSLAAVRSIGVDNAVVVGDLALALAPDIPPRPSALPKVAVNIALPGESMTGGPDSHALEAISESLASLTASGWELVGIAMSPEDVAPTRAVLANAGRPDAPVALPTSATEFFSAAGECTMSVCVRLHAAVLSSCVGVPPLMLGYRNKCLDFMMSMELDDWHLDVAHTPSEKIAERVKLLSEAAPSLRDAVWSHAREWQSVQKRAIRTALQRIAER